MTKTEYCPLDPKGIITYVRADYDWYGEGDYEIYDCTVHGEHWFALPD